MHCCSREGAPSQLLCTVVLSDKSRDVSFDGTMKDVFGYLCYQNPLCCLSLLIFLTVKDKLPSMRTASARLNCALLSAHRKCYQVTTLCHTGVKAAEHTHFESVLCGQFQAYW